jgi:MarR-like DNA-binding transcriptional regulator SgrR of sgrS sRNA
MIDEASTALTDRRPTNPGLSRHFALTYDEPQVASGEASLRRHQSETIGDDAPAAAQRREARRVSALRVAVYALLVAVAAATAHSGPADNTLRFLGYSALDSADPYFTSQRLAVVIADSVWDTLIYYDPRTGEYRGNLATGWRWIDDVTLELELRQGVRFHNGEPFDADDVGYTLGFAAGPGVAP